jgi:excisionase family DNA binding protein
VTSETTLAQTVVAALAIDADALERLRELIAPQAPRIGIAPAYTVATLASALGVTDRVIRNAIARGELRAVKRGARWYIAPGAVDAWTNAGLASPRARHLSQHRHPLTSTFAQLDERAARPA